MSLLSLLKSSNFNGWLRCDVTIDTIQTIDDSNSIRKHSTCVLHKQKTSCVRNESVTWDLTEDRCGDWRPQEFKHTLQKGIWLPFSLFSQGSLSLQYKGGKWGNVIQNERHCTIMQILQNFHFILGESGYMWIVSHVTTECSAKKGHHNAFSILHLLNNTITAVCTQHFIYAQNTCRIYYIMSKCVVCNWLHRFPQCNALDLV